MPVQDAHPAVTWHRGQPGARYRTECRSRNPFAGELSAGRSGRSGKPLRSGNCRTGGIMASRTVSFCPVRLALRGCENQETAVYRTARMAVSGESPVRSSLPRVFPGFLPRRVSVPPAGNRDGFLTERKAFII